MTYFIEDLILVPVTSEIFMPQIELIRCNFVVDPLPMSPIVYAPCQPSLLRRQKTIP